MFNDMDNLVGTFFEQADEFVEKEKEKQNISSSMLVSDETTKYQVMGNTAEVQNINDETGGEQNEF